MAKSSIFHISSTNPLVLKLSTQCTLQGTWDLNGCPLLCMFMTKHFSCCSVFSASHCTIPWCQRVNYTCNDFQL